jgi:hypothetical protein
MQIGRFSIAGIRAIWVLASVIFNAGSVLATDTQAVWQGYASVSASTQQCAGIAGTKVGDNLLSRFRPHIADGDTDTFLSQSFLGTAIAIDNTSEATVHQMNGSGSYMAYVVNSRAKGFTYIGTYSLTVAPPTIVAETPIVHITGTIKNLWNTSGCDVTFTGDYKLRTDNCNSESGLSLADVTPRPREPCSTQKSK